MGASHEIEAKPTGVRKTIAITKKDFPWIDNPSDQLDLWEMKVGEDNGSQKQVYIGSLVQSNRTFHASTENLRNTNSESSTQINAYQRELAAALVKKRETSLRHKPGTNFYNTGTHHWRAYFSVFREPSSGTTCVVFVGAAFGREQIAAMESTLFQIPLREAKKHLQGGKGI